jgi:urease accessory protein
VGSPARASWNPRLPAAAVAVLAAAYGALHGLSNGAAMGESGMQPLGLLGIAATVFALVALISAFVISLRAPWTRVAVRVAGSWIAAIGLLLLGWLSRGASG